MKTDMIDHSYGHNLSNTVTLKLEKISLLNGLKIPP